MNANGMTLTEVLVVVTLLGLSVSVASLSLSPLETPLHSGTVLLEGFFRQARRQAMATTSAYRIVPIGARRLTTQRASSCLDSTWVEVPTLRMNLASGVEMTDSSWIVCFSSRGISTNNVVVTLSHADFGTKQVEVLIGGTTRVIE